MRSASDVLVITERISHFYSFEKSKINKRNSIIHQDKTIALFSTESIHQKYKFGLGLTRKLVGFSSPVYHFIDLIIQSKVAHFIYFIIVSN